MRNISSFQIRFLIFSALQCHFHWSFLNQIIDRYGILDDGNPSSATSSSFHQSTCVFNPADMIQVNGFIDPISIRFDRVNTLFREINDLTVSSHRSGKVEDLNALLSCPNGKSIKFDSNVEDSVAISFTVQPLYLVWGASSQSSFVRKLFFFFKNLLENCSSGHCSLIAF